jgi:peptidoglycan/LPS O-acetylase OafA/YrhL
MEAMGHRFDALDALRGLAALSVVILHFLTVYGFDSPVTQQRALGWGTALLLSRTPLGIFYAGRDAVILFFILSGFVLALPFLDGRKPSYRTFAVRRVCRIYLPYVAALIVALSARALVTVEPVPGATEWFSFWEHPQSWRTVAGYLAMTGFPSHTVIDFVVWSLVHEMRISLIFPALVFSSLALRPLWLRLACFAAASLACSEAALMIDAKTIPALWAQSLLETGGYVWLFVLGIEMARFRGSISRWVCALSGRRFAIFLIGSLCLYCTRAILGLYARDPASEILIALGAAGIIATGLGRAGISRWLSSGFPHFAGRISYSLYLLHPIVLATGVYALHDRTSALLWLPALAVLTIGVAWLGWSLIEVPSIALGRFLTAVPRTDLEPQRVSV